MQIGWQFFGYCRILKAPQAVRSSFRLSYHTVPIPTVVFKPRNRHLLCPLSELT